MPLEIREIGIRMRVADSEPAPIRAQEPVAVSERTRERIVDDCVRRILAQLKARQER